MCLECAEIQGQHSQEKNDRIVLYKESLTGQYHTKEICFLILSTGFVSQDGGLDSSVWLEWAEMEGDEDGSGDLAIQVPKSET